MLQTILQLPRLDVIAEFEASQVVGIQLGFNKSGGRFALTSDEIGCVDGSER